MSFLWAESTHLTYNQKYYTYKHRYMLTKTTDLFNHNKQHAEYSVASKVFFCGGGSFLCAGEVE